MEQQIAVSMNIARIPLRRCSARAVQSNDDVIEGNVEPEWDHVRACVMLMDSVTGIHVWIQAWCSCWRCESSGVGIMYRCIQTAVLHVFTTTW